jgi:hypothetical protein
MSLSLFVLPQLLVKFLKGEVKFGKNTRFLVYAGLLPSLWYLLVPQNLNDIREINFLQHAIGGGVSVGLVAIYLINEFKKEHPFFSYFLVQLFVVYFLVSGFGVANEVLEFLLDYIKIGIFSADRYDTWFDLIANTSGGLSVFLLYKFSTYLLTSSDKS